MTVEAMCQDRAGDRSQLCARAGVEAKHSAIVTATIIAAGEAHRPPVILVDNAISRPVTATKGTTPEAADTGGVSGVSSRVNGEFVEPAGAPVVHGQRR